MSSTVRCFCAAAKATTPWCVEPGRNPLNLFSRFEPDRDAATAAKIDDFLDARSAGALGYQHSVHGATGGERLTYGVHPYKD